MKKIQFSFQKKLILLQVSAFDVLLGAKCWSLLFLSANLQSLFPDICAVFTPCSDLSRQSEPHFPGHGFYC